MAATAAHGGAYSCSATDASYSTLVGFSDVSFSDSNGLIDISSYDVAGIVKRLQGLQDGSISGSGFWESSTAQNLIRSSKTSGADVYIQCLFDGTNGYSVPCKIESYTIGGSVADKVGFSFSASFNGAIIAKP